MIYLGFNVYNEGLTLYEAISKAKETFRDTEHQIIVLDGAYVDYPYKNNNPKSIDDTLAIAYELADTVIEREEPWEGEIEKRNEFFTFLKDGDYLLEIDGDEVMEGYFTGEFDFRPVFTDKPILTVTYPDYASTWLQRDDYNPAQPYKIFRWFKYQAGMKFAGSHNSLFVNDIFINKGVWDNKFPTMCGVVALHKTKTSPSRNQEKSVYCQRLKEKERNFVAENCK